MRLLQGPSGGRFLMSEVPLYLPPSGGPGGARASFPLRWRVGSYALHTYALALLGALSAQMLTMRGLFRTKRGVCAFALGMCVLARKV